MSIALLIYWIFIKVMVFVESAPKIGDVYYDPLGFEPPDSYPVEDGEPPVLRNQGELLHIDARKPYEGYLYDANHCKQINGRILCGYDKNKGRIEEEEHFIDMGNGCFSRGDRIECGYGIKPLNKLLRIPVLKAASSHEISGENKSTRQTPTRTALKTVPTTTMTPDMKPLLIKNDLLKSAMSKTSVKLNKLKKKARKEKTKEKKSTTSETTSIETEIATSAASTIPSKITNDKYPSSKFNTNPTPESSKMYVKITPPTTKLDIGPLESVSKIDSEQYRIVPNGNVNQTLPTSKIVVDPLPPTSKIGINVTLPASEMESGPTSPASKLHIDQTTEPETETDVPPTLAVDERDSLSNSDSSEYLSSDTNNDNIVVLHKNDIDTAVRNKQSVESLSDEPDKHNEHNRDRIGKEPPTNDPDIGNNDSDSEINRNSADTTATACVEKQDRVVCYNYKTEAYE